MSSIVARANPRFSKVDYREILTAPQFAVYSRLRDRRKVFATQEGVPVYSLFSNQQLAAIVQNNVTTIGELRKIKGVGESRVDKYGEVLLAVMRDAALPSEPAAADET